MNEWIVHTIPKALRGTGVELAFEIQGNEVAKLVGGVQAAGIGFVLARNQTAAAMMTAGAATVGGARISCHHAGPGLAKAASGIADAVARAALPRLPVYEAGAYVGRP